MRLIRYELAMWRGLHRLVTRRPPELAPGEEAFAHAGPVKPIFAVFIVLSAVEIPVIDLIISRVTPWAALRHVALFAGIYGLVWMVGLLGALLTNPHAVGDAGIRLRNGTSVDVVIPWDAIDTVRHRYRSLPSSRAVQVDRAGEHTVVSLPSGSQTAVDVTLRRPLTLPIHKIQDQPVNEVRFYADDPKALVARCRDYAAA